MDKNDERRSAALREFYDLYIPLKRRYGLRMRAHESIYDDAYIVINEYRGEGEGRVICRARNEDTALCYEQATAELKYYAKCKEEERRHEKRTG